MLNSLSTGADDAGMQRKLEAILASGGNLSWLFFQNASGSSSCDKQGVRKYSSTNSSILLAVGVESAGLSIKLLKKVLAFFAGG